MISPPTLVFVIIGLLSCSLFSLAMEVSEAQQIALESLNELLPPQDVVQTIENDLIAVRAKFPAVANVKHTPKWEAGKLTISNAKKESLESINTSKYGPAEVRPIFQDIIVLVTFKKPYNPEILSERLKTELGITEASPDGIIGGSSSVTLTRDTTLGKNTYVFMKGWGDCPSGCIHKHFWTFTVGPQQKSVDLVEERGDDLATANEGNQSGIVV